jgi:hypothetical protein
MTLYKLTMKTVRNLSSIPLNMMTNLRTDFMLSWIFFISVYKTLKYKMLTGRKLCYLYRNLVGTDARVRTHTKELKLLETLKSRIYCIYIGPCGKWVTGNTDTGFPLPGDIDKHNTPRSQILQPRWQKGLLQYVSFHVINSVRFVFKHTTLQQTTPPQELSISPRAWLNALHAAPSG